MSIKLRKRSNQDGSTSLVLDIYHEGKRSYEFLKHLKLQKGNTILEREENKQRIKLAKEILNKREQELQANEYTIIPDFKKSVDLLEFMDSFVFKYSKKDKRVVSALVNKFKEFLILSNLKSIRSKQLSPQIVMDFKEFLESNFQGETPANYFKKFKLILKSACRNGILKSDPSADIRIKRKEGIKKEILTMDEIKMLSNTPLANVQVKNAFLFSCFTGLRFSDIISLQWKSISDGILRVNQNKTGLSVTINLHKSAIPLLGSPKNGDDFVFALPSHNACLKNLESWCKRAGIRKHITWHCARHSFATNLIFWGGGIGAASSLLGHGSWNYTKRYVRESEKLKERAIDNLPSLD